LCCDNRNFCTPGSKTSFYLLAIYYKGRNSTKGLSTAQNTKITAKTMTKHNIAQKQCKLTITIQHDERKKPLVLLLMLKSRYEGIM